MKEYIKKFDSAASADNYSIVDIPFMTSVDENPIQNLVCNKTGKHLENDNGTVIICPPDVDIEMVDLGLSVKWAKYNVGVNPEDLSTADKWYGDFYAWGETETKSNYTWSTYKYANGAYNKLTKYCPSNKTDQWDGEGSPDNKLVLDAVDDVATTIYGSNYHMPTQAELEELITLQTTWVTNYDPTKIIHNYGDDGGINGLNGRVFTGTNGNQLFIPAAGVFRGSSPVSTRSNCKLWSSSLNSSPRFAYCLDTLDGRISVGGDERYTGFSVRAVSAAS